MLWSTAWKIFTLPKASCLSKPLSLMTSMIRNFSVLHCFKHHSFNLYLCFNSTTLSSTDPVSLLGLFIVSFSWCSESTPRPVSEAACEKLVLYFASNFFDSCPTSVIFKAQIHHKMAHWICVTWESVYISSSIWSGSIQGRSVDPSLKSKLQSLTHRWTAASIYKSYFY